MVVLFHKTTKHYLSKGSTTYIYTHIKAAYENNQRYILCVNYMVFTHYTVRVGSGPYPAMTPAQFDLMMKRIIAVGTPKESWCASVWMWEYNPKKWLYMALYIYTLHIPYSQTKVVVLLILLVWWLDLPKCDAGPYQVLEYFAGVGRIAAIGKFTGRTSAALDISYGEHLGKRMGKRKRSPMDLNSDAGLVLLACKHVWKKDISQTLE